MSSWRDRVCLKLQRFFLIPPPCCFKIPSQLISASVLTSGSTKYIFGCKCMLANLALLPPESTNQTYWLYSGLISLQVTIERAILEDTKIDVMIAQLEMRFPEAERSSEA